MPSSIKPPNNTAFNRRQLLQALGAGTSFWAAPALWAQATNTPEKIAAQASPIRPEGSFDVNGRLVVVFLRGAYDGLSALVPHGDPNYYRLRPNIAIAPPDGTAQTTLALDAQFGLHPALAALAPLWQRGLLGVIPAAGSPDPTRSHFDAQLHWELDMPGQSSAGAGWLNRLAAPYSRTVALGVGEANPLILAGPAPVQLVPKGLAATRQGVLGDERTRQAVMNLYGGDDALSKAFRAGADSRMQTAQTLSAGASQNSMMNAEMVAANNGAGSPQGLQLDAQHLGTLMRQNPLLRLGFLSAGGWDTHANQGAATGNLAQNLGNLSTALLQLRRDFSEANDVVLVCSEFGRTSAENGTRGTDHGHGNALWLMGNAVQGGRWHGQWQGLAPDRLHEGRDLPVHHDFRAVIAQVLQRTQGLDRQALGQLFPGFSWDASLNGLMRA
jgi:uncharacterized protein (DUF1501 family)